jgi:hypothetical protein
VARYCEYTHKADDELITNCHTTLCADVLCRDVLCCAVLLRRRRPFLVKGLEATLNKFILSLEFYDEEGRKKIAMSE